MFIESTVSGCVCGSETFTEKQINHKLSINMKNHYLSFLLLLLVEGVFSEVMMAVMEGDSVTLKIDVTEIQGKETLLWKFNGQDEFLAKIDRETNKITVPGNNNDGRFRNRLQVDQIGSLTITNIRTEDSGPYSLENSGGIPYKNFRVTVYRESDVEMKSVIKGDSVPLQTDFTEIQTGDEIQWSYFTPEETRITRLTIETRNIDSRVQDAADGRFIDRLTVNRKTGYLIISDVTTERSGLYKLEITGSQTTSKMFRVTVSDEFNVTSLSVMEGESVTLQTDFTEILTDELLLWTFDTEGTVIAKINRAHNQISVYDGKFRGVLEFDRQTGSLTISNIGTENSGHYSLKISNSRGTKYNRFNVNVKERPPVVPAAGPSSGAIAGIIAVVVLLLLLVVGVIYHRRKVSELRNQIDGGAAIVQQEHLNSGH